MFTGSYFSISSVTSLTSYQPQYGSVCTKSRSDIPDHVVVDTDRGEEEGVTKQLVNLPPAGQHSARTGAFSGMLGTLSRLAHHRWTIAHLSAQPNTASDRVSWDLESLLGRGDSLKGDDGVSFHQSTTSCKNIEIQYLSTFLLYLIIMIRKQILNLVSTSFTLSSPKNPV